MASNPVRIFPFPPRGLNRAQAAMYIGISRSLFDRMVKDGRMPRPKRIDGRVVWDRHQIDESFEDLTSNNPWNDNDDQNSSQISE